MPASTGEDFVSPALIRSDVPAADFGGAELAVWAFRHREVKDLGSDQPCQGIHGRAGLGRHAGIVPGTGEAKQDRGGWAQPVLGGPPKHADQMIDHAMHP